MSKQSSLDYDGLDGILQSSSSKARWYRSAWIFALAIIPLIGAFLLFRSNPQQPTSTLPLKPNNTPSLINPPTEKLPLPLATTSNSISHQQAPSTLDSNQPNVPEMVAETKPIQVDDSKIDLPPMTSTESLFTLHFSFDSSKLSALSKTQLTNLINAAKSCPNQIELAGHTCNIGNAASNQILGLTRAKAVKKLLMANGIAAQKIITLSRGMDSPITSNDSVTGQKLNRRVELTCQDR
jgi:OmpA-OmpF porin, OOP family